MRNSVITFVLFVLIVLQNATAQQMPFSSQYYSNQFITNPALTGNKGSTNAFITHRTQWAGISGTPQTTYFSIDGPVKRDGVGLGLYAYSDVTDILSRTGFNASYSYRIALDQAKNHHLTFGLALGAISNKINFSKIIVLDNSDPILNSQQQARTVLNVDFGLAYNWKKLEVGFAIPQLMGNKVNYTNNVGMTGTYNMARHYYGSVKYVFDVNQSRGITAYPLLMIRSVAGAPFQYDFNGVVDWKRRGWVGVTYHSNYAVAVSAGIRYKSLSFGYAYDMGISKIRKYTGTTSEFLLSYTFASNDPTTEPPLWDTLMKKIQRLEEHDSIQAMEIDSLTKNDSIKQLKLDSLQQQVDSNTVEIERLKEKIKEIDAKAHTHNPGDVHNPSDTHKKNDPASEAEKKKLAEEKEKLEKELREKKEKEDSLKMAQELAEKDIHSKTDNSKGYISVPGGTSVKAGYYVIIGAFTSVDNAKIFARDAKRKGYQTAVIIQNKVNSIYEIVVYMTTDKTNALGKLDGIKSDYPDVWVLTLE